MSLFGALFTAVSGMSAQSQATAMISNNIANVDTVGFKGSDAAFYSLVTSATNGGQYSPGTVDVNRVQNVTQQGAIQQTSSGTDAAITGNGFFTVKQDPSSQLPFLYTRAGSFQEDSTGLLRNSSGFALYAWPLGTNGQLPSNEGDISSLVPANVAFLGGLTKPTTTADMSLNLDANQTDIVPELNPAPSVLPLTATGANAVAANFTRGLTVYDSLGAAQNMSIQFRKVQGPMAHATTSTQNLTLSTSLTDPAVFGNISAGNKFSVTTGTPAATQTYIIGAAPGAGEVRVDTVGDLITQINTVFGGGTAAKATLDDSGRLVIQADNPTSTLTLANVAAGPAPQTPLGAGGSPPVTTGTLNFAGQPGNPALAYTAQAPVQPVGAPPGNYVGTTYPQQGDFPAIANDLTPNTQGWWEMSILKPDGTALTQGLVNFNGDGTLNASPDANSVTGVSLKNIDWNNGSDLANIDIDISKFTQFAGQYNVVSTDQNGAALGLRTGVEITKDGTIVAQFSNGATANLYKIPMSTFSNPDGLQEESGTAYSETSTSGTNNLREAGTGGAGFLQPSSLEGSNIDLADEFAKLIVSQRAYTADTRVVNTVDQMTQDLLRLV
jgi:flagellar hook protein FlgE